MISILSPTYFRFAGWSDLYFEAILRYSTQKSYGTRYTEFVSLQHFWEPFQIQPKV